MALTSATDTKPAMMAPTGYPDWSMATANFWRLALLYSDTMVVRLDNMPPTPRPVISRVISNVVTSWANAEVNMPTEMMARPIRIRVRRPWRSASGERNSAPMTIPARPALKTTPNTAGSRAHSRAISGAAKAMDSTSKPSMKLMMMQISTALV